MGREIKRVPLDFDWPVDKLWRGYINPHYASCPKCGGCGKTTARKRLGEMARLILLSGYDSKREKSHPYFDWFALHYTAGVAPSKDMVELSEGLAGRAASFMGHDAIDAYRAEKKIISAAGLDSDKWGICEHCHGSGEDPATKELSDAWESFDPPCGDAYQLWSTTTEGHPMSPPRATPEDLARWLADNNVSTFGSDTATYDEWLCFIGVGWAVSAVSSGGTLKSGVVACQSTQPEQKL